MFWAILAGLGLLAGAQSGLQAAGIDTWTLQSPVFGSSTMRGVARGADKWVAVGDNGVTGTAVDGRHWVRGTSGTTAALGAITFGGGRYVAVGTGGLILSSSNGTSWGTARAARAGSTAEAMGAAYGNGTYVALQLDASLAFSADGVNWTDVQLAVPGRSCVLRGLTFANGQFLAVGGVSTDFGSGALIFTSTDGRNWTRRAETLVIDTVGNTSGITLTAVGFGGGLFVVVGESTGIATSPDGVNWTARRPTTGVFSSGFQLTAIAHGDGGFVVWAGGKYLTSPDGLTWNLQTVAPQPYAATSFNSTSMAFADGVFVAAGYAGQMAIKTAVEDWTVSTAFFSSVEMRGATYGNGRFVATTYDGGSVVSSDGYRWQSGGNHDGYGFYRVAYGNGIFVTASDHPSKLGVSTSTDGMSWTFHPSAVAPYGMVYAREKFVGAGSGFVASSADGITWTKRLSAPTKFFGAVAEGNGRFVAVGFQGAVATSPDGDNWTEQPVPTSDRLAAIAFGAGRFVAVVSNGNRIWSSVDGSAWSLANLPAVPADDFTTRGGGYRDIIFADNRFVAVIGSHIVTSLDGVTWTTVPNALGQEQYPDFYLAFGNGAFLAIGRGGLVYASETAATAIGIGSVSSDVSVDSGQSATLTVNATGPSLAYQWYRGSSGDRTNPIAGGTGPSLVVPGLTQDSFFWVRVSNANASLDSPTVTVRVRLAPVVTPDARELEAIAGDPINLTTVVTGTPAPTLQWYRGRRGDTTRPISGATASGVNLPAPTTIERYWLRATNALAIVDSDEIRVTPWTKLASNYILGARRIGDQLISVGGENIVTSSDDGRTWTKRSTILNGSLVDIAQGAGVYVAVGQRFFSSPDLVTWTERNIASPGNYNGVSAIARGNGTFVTAGFTSFRSANGLDWTAITLPADVHFNSVLFDGFRFVAVGFIDRLNDFTADEVGVVFTSPDGVAWTRRGIDALAETLENARTTLSRVIFAGGKYVATASEGRFVLVSPDAVNWTRSAIASLVGGRPRAIAYANGRYLIATDSLAYYRSTDAITWTTVAAAPGVSTPSLVATDAGEFLLIGSGSATGEVIMVSPDGEHWTTRSATPTPYLGLDGIAYGAGRGVGIGSSSLYVSDDGVAWEYSTPNRGGGRQLAFASGHFVRPGDTTGTLFVSPDGRNWRRKEVSGATGAFSRIVVAGDRLFALGGGGVATSGNGEDWTFTPYAGGFTFTDVAFGNNTYVGVGSNITGSTIVVSGDGVNWAPPPVPPAATVITAVTYGNGRFLAIGQNFNTQLVYSSLNGVTWTSRDVPPGFATSPVDVGFVGDRFLMARSDGVLFSLDGVTWQAGPTGVNGNLFLTPFNGGVLCGTALVRAVDEQATSIVAVSPATEIAAGGQATLVVNATGPSLRYQWSRLVDGFPQAMPGATNAALSVPAPSQAERYSVRVSGPGGAVESRSILVSAPTPPVITRQPFSADLTSTSLSAVLRVEADSAAPMTYQWYVGTSGNTRAPILQATAATFVPPSVDAAVSYWVRVANRHGSTDSASALITPWKSVTFRNDAVAFGAIGLTHGQGKFLVTGTTFTPATGVVGSVATSTDGEQWTFTSTGAVRLGAVAFGAGKFVAVSNTRLYASGDGATWDVVWTESGTIFTNVVFAGGRFVATTLNGRVTVSSDGATWSTTAAATVELTSVVFGNGVYLGTTTAKQAMMSSDGASWSAVPGSLGTNVNSVAFGGGRFLLVATDGTARTSTDGQQLSATAITLVDDIASLPPLSVVAAAGGRFFSHYDSQFIGAYASADGVSWGTSLPFTRLVAGPANYFVIASGGAYRSRPGMALGIVAPPSSQAVYAGRPVTFTALVAGDASLTYQWRRAGVPVSDSSGRISGATTPTLTIARVTPADAGRYELVATAGGATVVSSAATLAVVLPPAMTTQPAPQTVASGGNVTFTASATVAAGETVAYQWQRNGADLPNATNASLTLTNVQPADAGVYAVAVNGGAGGSDRVILGVETDRKVIGAATEVGANIVHPNGHIYDQVLLQGAAATVTADPGEVTRISYIDLNDDIVQVEFSGAGSLTLTLENATGPATPVKYNQAVAYMRGHASIVIVGADETTNVSVFSVGRANAVNQPLFRTDTTYDGVADFAFIAIRSRSGDFGGLRTANGSYFATHGVTGLFAPGVNFKGPVYLGDVDAIMNATPVLRLGAASEALILGGSLRQDNAAAIELGAMVPLRFDAGTTSHGTLLPAQANQARFEVDGVDVTDAVVPPGP